MRRQKCDNCKRKCWAVKLFKVGIDHLCRKCWQKFFDSITEEVSKL